MIEMGILKHKAAVVLAIKYLKNLQWIPTANTNFPHAVYYFWIFLSVISTVCSECR